MAWQITSKRAEAAVGVEALGGDRFRVTVDGEGHEVSASFSEPGVLSLARGSERWQADVVRSDGHAAVTIDGRRHDLGVVDERQLALAALGLGGPGGAENIVSTSMPGKVVALLVSEGDAVEEGQGVIVVEAMKMENELRAAVSGTVASIVVAAGDTVEGGSPLIIIEPRAD